MNFDFEELDYQKTPLGEISLRRRAEPRLEGKIIYEVKLGDEFLMSSLFTAAEVQLAKLGLAELTGREMDVRKGDAFIFHLLIAIYLVKNKCVPFSLDQVPAVHRLTLGPRKSISILKSSNDEIEQTRSLLTQ